MDRRDEEFVKGWERMMGSTDSLVSEVKSLREEIDRKDDTLTRTLAKDVKKIGGSVIRIETVLTQHSGELKELKARPVVDEAQVKSMVDSGVGKRFYNCLQTFKGKNEKSGVSPVPVAPPSPPVPEKPGQSWSITRQILVVIGAVTVAVLSVVATVLGLG